MNNEMILLTWLHNIYLHPKTMTIRVATSKYVNALHDDGLVEFSGKYVTRATITPKGKKLLQRNLHLLLDDEIPGVDVKPPQSFEDVEAHENVVAS